MRESTARNKNVLVHPSRHPKFGALGQLWHALRHKSHIVPLDHNLLDTAYINNLPLGTTLIVGGQEAGVCLSTHLSALATNGRVQNKELTIKVSRQLVYGENLDNVVNRIKNLHPNVEIEIID